MTKVTPLAKHTKLKWEQEIKISKQIGRQKWTDLISCASKVKPVWGKSCRNDFHTSKICVWDISFLLWHAGELPSNTILHNEFHGNVSFLIGADSDDEVSPGVPVYIVPLCFIGVCGWQEMAPDSDDSGELVSQHEKIRRFTNWVNGGSPTFGKCIVAERGTETTDQQNKKQGQFYHQKQLKLLYDFTVQMDDLSVPSFCQQSSHQ